MGDDPFHPSEMEPDFDEVREDVAYQLDEDQFAGFIVVAIDENGEVNGPWRAIDGNRIPGGASKQQAMAGMVAQVVHDVLPGATVADLICEAAGITPDW